MSSADRYLAPCSPDQPCGEDLSNDPALRHLRSVIQGKVQEKIVTDDNGNGRVDAVREEPDWREVRQLCEDAMARTRHLEICATYATALVQLEGLPGAADALELIAGLVRQYWEQIYPRLDPEDENNPAQRFGIIENLSMLPVVGYYDPLRFVDRLRSVPLAEARGLGVISMATFKGGRIPEPGTPDAKPIEAAFSRMRESGEISLVEKNTAALPRAVEALKQLRTFLSEVPEGRTPDFEALERALASQQRFYQFYASGGSSAASGYSAGAGASGGGSDAGGVPSFTPAAGGPVVAAPGSIQTTAQIVEVLDRICAYYAQAEPSSPVPILLRRARRLVGKTFLEAVADMAGGPIEQIRVVAGEPFPEIPQA